jgi:hypothetical protein
MIQRWPSRSVLPDPPDRRTAFRTLLAWLKSAGDPQPVDARILNADKQIQPDLWAEIRTPDRKSDRQLYETAAALDNAAMILAESESQDATGQQIEKLCEEVIRRRLLFQHSEIRHGWRPRRQIQQRMNRDHLLIYQRGSPPD